MITCSSGCDEKQPPQMSFSCSPLTLAQEHVLWEVPEGRLHHFEVAAAHAVHERWQEVGRQAALVTKPPIY